MTSPPCESWREAVELAPHEAVGRIVVRGGADGGRTVVVKRVPRHEVLVHRLVQEAQPGVIPPVLAAWPIPGGDVWVMVLPDLGPAVEAADPSSRGPVAVRDLLQAGLERLAVIHHTFSRAEELAGLDLPVPGAWAQTWPVGSVRLAQRNSEWALGLHPDQVRLWEQSELTLPALYDVLADEQSWTLVHGDLHAANIVRAADGAVWLIDWGSACRLAPAWDLATFDAHLVNTYVSARARVGRLQDLTSFFRQLRAATAIRLHGAVRDLLEDQPPIGIGHELRVQAIRSCVARALLAHVTVDFRGG